MLVRKAGEEGLLGTELNELRAHARSIHVSFKYTNIAFPGRIP